jgi:leader peptidase (prepilin peptidase)/N-methyltransferase
MRQEVETGEPSPCLRKDVMGYVIVFILGLIVGSSINLCLNRISPVYTAVQLTNAILYIVAFHRLGIGLSFIRGAVLISLAIVVSLIDLKEQVIPDSLIVVAATAGILLTVIDGSHSFTDALLGFGLGGGIFLAIAIVSKGGMGGGDVKFMAAMGLFLGWRLTLVALFLSFVTGGLFGTFMLLTGKKKRKDAVPFGPFLGGSAIVATLYGQQLVSLYLSIILGGGIMKTH